jgi:hypothetical protein
MLAILVSPGSAPPLAASVFQNPISRFGGGFCVAAQVPVWSRPVSGQAPADAIVG